MQGANHEQIRADIELHPNQRVVVSTARRFNVVCCGRRWGKTKLGIDRAVQTLARGLPVGWFAPTYKYVTDVWQEISQTLDRYAKRRDRTEKRLELNNGAHFEMWTLDNPDAGRSRRYATVIVDEAAMVRNLGGAWMANIRPTLTDFRGNAWFLSTPKGLNDFWEMYQKGSDETEPEWASWQMPTISNPYITSDEIESARKGLPERIFAQEYLAEFLSDGGGVFRRVMEAATALPKDNGDPSKRYIYGLDWGKHEDFTVIVVLDPDTKRMVYMDRFNQIDYVVQENRLKALAERFRPLAIIAERNSIGERVVEQLKRDGLPVQPFTTTHASKTAIIDGLALAFERGEIEILNDSVLTGELLAYDMERLPSGTLRYSAPPGKHDDCVMALALAWYGCAERVLPADLDFGGLVQSSKWRW